MCTMLRRRCATTALAVATGLAAWLHAGRVAAQPREANRPPAEVANDLVKQAITRSQDGDHLGAIDLYLNAYSLIPQHTLLSNVGAEYQQAGQPIEALKYFCMYLDKDPTGTNATYATSKAKSIQIELGNKGVDDATACKLPPAGRSGRRDPGRDTRPDRGDRPPSRGDRRTGGADRPPRAATASASEGAAEPPPPRPGRGLRIGGIAMGFAGVAALGVGGYFGYIANDRSTFITNYVKENGTSKPWPQNIKDLEAEGQDAEDKQIALSIAGGALVATGVVLYIVGATRGGAEPPAARRGAPRRELAAAPVVGGGLFGIAVAGGF
jgi:hypothetical protein